MDVNHEHNARRWGTGVKAHWWGGEAAPGSKPANKQLYKDLGDLEAWHKNQHDLSFAEVNKAHAAADEQADAYWNERDPGGFHYHKEAPGWSESFSQAYTDHKERMKPVAEYASQRRRDIYSKYLGPDHTNLWGEPVSQWGYSDEDKEAAKAGQDSEKHGQTFGKLPEYGENY